MQQLRVSKQFRRHLIFGANTDVGKTIVSAGLVRAAAFRGAMNYNHKDADARPSDYYCHYIKPLQTGVHASWNSSNSNIGNIRNQDGEDGSSDAAFVHRVATALPMPNFGGASKENAKDYDRIMSLEANRVQCSTLFHWNNPVSPHLASRMEQDPVSDDEILIGLKRSLVESQKMILDNSSNPTISVPTIIETAGGALSPASCSPLNQAAYHAFRSNNTKNDSYSGTCSEETYQWGWSTQADLYKMTRIPAVLVGDGKLGGIACTLSTLESLLVRGYDVHSIVLINEGDQEDDRESNTIAIREYLSRQFSLRAGDGSQLFRDVENEVVSLPSLPPMPIPLDDWFTSSAVIKKFESINSNLDKKWAKDMDRLHSMRGSGRKCVWWPFTQHGSIKDDEDITLIDGATGDYYNVLLGDGNCKSTSLTENMYLTRMDMFDACASWWTQGMGHGETTMALATAAAAGRYGHVIFPDAAHNPAIALAEYLVGPKGPGKGWASRVFYSDDGSTAIEVGIKMAMKKFASTHYDASDNENPFGPPGISLAVLAQEDCYHGDTLGCMDVAVPSIFNQGQHPWYSPRGLFLQTPTLGFVDGIIEILIPASECTGNKGSETFESVSMAMDVEHRLNTDLYRHYVEQICKIWNDFEIEDKESTCKQTIGCVLIEPVLMGAGGMKFVDPLWQRALIDEARRRQVPIIFDEIAAGLYRLGVSSCKDILKVSPDIACYAKLLTGGVVPLSVTIASEDVFNSFLGESKAQALLHGHSYTAHPIGCNAALHALEAYDKTIVQSKPSYFDENAVKGLSKKVQVAESFALGTVLAIKIKGEEGYGALQTSKPVIEHLRNQGVYARPLGNVVYIMVSPFTSAVECSRLTQLLNDAIDEIPISK